MSKKYCVALFSKIKSRQKLRAALIHNRREHISYKCLHIDQDKTLLNYGINSDLSTDQVMEFVSNQIKENGVKVRKNSVYGVEIVISLSTWDIDYRSFFEEVYRWALAYYKVPILSCQIHLDERKPHMHLLLLPIRGNRMVGSSLVGYKFEMARFNKSLYDQVGKKFKLSADFKELANDNAEMIIKKLQGDSIRYSSYWNLFAQVIREKPNLFIGIIGL